MAVDEGAARRNAHYRYMKGWVEGAASLSAVASRQPRVCTSTDYQRGLEDGQRARATALAEDESRLGLRISKQV